MPYMTQKMSSGQLLAVTYYRKQISDHPSHAESGAFTTTATSAYAVANNIPVDQVVVGNYKSGQGIPTGGATEEI